MASNKNACHWKSAETQHSKLSNEKALFKAKGTPSKKGEWGQPQRGGTKNRAFLFPIDYSGEG